MIGHVIKNKQKSKRVRTHEIAHNENEDENEKIDHIDMK